MDVSSSSENIRSSIQGWSFDSALSGMPVLIYIE
jgi:hypothetical protein